MPQIDLPVFGYKSHISIDRRFGLIQESVVASASYPDGRMLPGLMTTENIASDVWAGGDVRISRATSSKMEPQIRGRNYFASRNKSARQKSQRMSRSTFLCAISRHPTGCARMSGRRQVHCAAVQGNCAPGSRVMPHSVPLYRTHKRSVVGTTGLPPWLRSFAR